MLVYFEILADLVRILIVVMSSDSHFSVSRSLGTNKEPPISDDAIGLCTSGPSPRETEETSDNSTHVETPDVDDSPSYEVPPKYWIAEKDLLMGITYSDVVEHTIDHIEFCGSLCRASDASKSELNSRLEQLRQVAKEIFSCEKNGIRSADTFSPHDIVNFAYEQYRKLMVMPTFSECINPRSFRNTFAETRMFLDSIQYRAEHATERCDLDYLLETVRECQNDLIAEENPADIMDRAFEAFMDFKNSNAFEEFSRGEDLMRIQRATNVTSPAIATYKKAVDELYNTSILFTLAQDKAAYICIKTGIFEVEPTGQNDIIFSSRVVPTSSVEKLVPVDPKYLVNGIAAPAGYVYPFRTIYEVIDSKSFKELELTHKEIAKNSLDYFRFRAQFLCEPARTTILQNNDEASSYLSGISGSHFGGFKAGMTSSIVDTAHKFYNETISVENDRTCTIDVKDYISYLTRRIIWLADTGREMFFKKLGGTVLSNEQVKDMLTESDFYSNVETLQALVEDGRTALGEIMNRAFINFAWHVDYLAKREFVIIREKSWNDNYSQYADIMSTLDISHHSLSMTNFFSSKIELLILNEFGIHTSLYHTFDAKSRLLMNRQL